MNIETYSMIIWVLLGSFLLTQGIWLWSTHTLVNKVMSNSFYEYKQSKNLKPETKETVINFDQEPLEDLRGLSELN